MNEMFVAHEDGKHRCYVLGRDGRSRQWITCAHEKPREAIAHVVPVYVNPLRLPDESPAIPPEFGTAGDGRLIEATTASPRNTPPLSSPRRRGYGASI